MAHAITGTVVSDKADKTIVIVVESRKTHPVYKKQYKITKRYMAHDEKNEAHTGDKVMIEQCRPMSARKQWILKSIIARAGVEHVEAETFDVTQDKGAKV